MFPWSNFFNPGSEPLTCSNDQHPLTGAGLAAVVDLVRRPFVELGPEGLRFPRLELRLDLGIEVGKFRRLEPEYFAKVTKRSEDGLEGVGLTAEVVEHLVGQGDVDVDALRPDEAPRGRGLILFVGHFVRLILLVWQRCNKGRHHSLHSGD